MDPLSASVRSYVEVQLQFTNGQSELTRIPEDEEMNGSGVTRKQLCLAVLAWMAICAIFLVMVVAS